MSDFTDYDATNRKSLARPVSYADAAREQERARGLDPVSAYHARRARMQAIEQTLAHLMHEARQGLRATRRDDPNDVYRRMRPPARRRVRALIDEWLALHAEHWGLPPRPRPVPMRPPRRAGAVTRALLSSTDRVPRRT